MAKENELTNAEVKFTVQQLMDLLDVQSKKHDETMMKVVAEMKKPNEYEQRKIDAEELKLARQRQARRDEMLNEEQVRLSAQRACRHKRRTKDGEASGWAGQVNNDGYVRFICTQCQMVAPEVLAPREWNGMVSAQDPNGPLYHLTLDQIQYWHKLYGPKPKTRVRGTLPEKEAVGA